MCGSISPSEKAEPLLLCSKTKMRTKALFFAHFYLFLCIKNAFYENILGEIKELFLPLHPKT